MLDRALLEHEVLNVHLLSNGSPTALSRGGFMNFLAAVGVEPLLVDFRTAG